MIKKIYTFGTSYTEGGGYEWHNDHLKYSVIHAYKGVPDELTMKNFSYPGQLQKLLSDTKYGIEVINLGKSGYGNERLYRKATDITMMDDFDKDTTLFLFEFSWTGRKELYSRALKDYIILNYSNPDHENRPDFTTVHGYASDYVYDDNNTHNQKMDKIPDGRFYQQYCDTVINHDIQFSLLKNSTTTFLSYLTLNKINFLTVVPPHYIEPCYWDTLLYPNIINTFPDYDGHNLVGESGLIQNETLDFHHDRHWGYISNKWIASLVYDELIDRNFIDGTKLNKKRKDFDYINNIILNNIKNSPDCKRIIKDREK
jgi:hypothetical protein